MNEDRLRRQVAELQRRAEELKDEVRRLERRQLEQLEAKKAAAGAAMAEAAAPATASRQAARAPAREEETRRREEPAAAAAAAAGSKPTGKADNGGGGSSKPSKVTYPNGTQKRNFPNGDVVIHFNNGDVKKTKGTTTEYYYAEVDTWHTTHNNGIEVFHFPSGQVSIPLSLSLSLLCFGWLTRLFGGLCGSDRGTLSQRRQGGPVPGRRGAQADGPGGRRAPAHRRRRALRGLQQAKAAAQNLGVTLFRKIL